MGFKFPSLQCIKSRVGTGQYYGHFFLDNNLLVNAGDMMNRMGDGDKDSGAEKDDVSVRGKWVRLQRDLENERYRNQRIYHAFLPRPLAMTIQKGEIPEAGMYNITSCSCSFFLNFWLDIFFLRFGRFGNIMKTFVKTFFHCSSYIPFFKMHIIILYEYMYIYLYQIYFGNIMTSFFKTYILSYISRYSKCMYSVSIFLPSLPN